MEAVSVSCTVAVLLSGGVMLGALQGGGVPADGVACVGPHQGQGRHPPAVDVVPIADAAGPVIESCRHGVDEATAKDATVDAHAATLLQYEYVLVFS